MSEPKTKNGNQLMLKIVVGVIIFVLAGAVKYTASVVADSRVHAAKIDALERDRAIVAERLDRFRIMIDERLRDLERQVARANAKLDTMMKDRIANHQTKGTGR